jgi:hypothetical protein
MSNRAYKLYPHAPIEQLLPGLWRVAGSMSLPIERSMFVYRLRDNSLLLDSVVAMEEEGMQALEALGPPTVMVVPHPKHTMDAVFYKRRYPHIRALGERDAQRKLDELTFDDTPDRGLPPLGITPHVVPGMSSTEVVLELPLAGGKRALLFTDLINRNEGPSNVMMRLVGPPGDGGVARILKLTQIDDTGRVRAFLRQMAAIPSLSLIAGCHGGIVTENCAAWLNRAADQL